MKPAQLESLGLAFVVLGVAALVAAAWLVVGLWLALVLFGTSAAVAGLVTIKAAAMAEGGER